MQRENRFLTIGREKKAERAGGGREIRIANLGVGKEIRMGKGRLEAFSDGVIAVIITIMVLELKAPHGHGLADLRPLIPVFLSYVLSFVFLCIYWNNHHHLLQAVKHVNGPILWANANLLFWLSLVPFVTSWMGENHFKPVPMALYGVVMLCSGIAFTLLVRVLIRHHGKDSDLARALGANLSGDWKGHASVVMYSLAIPSAFLNPWISGCLYVAVAVMWLIPDRRIERVIGGKPGSPD
jgi:uncharacterized membrane protein